MGCTSVRALPPFTRDFEGNDRTTAVFSGVSEDYGRNKLPDGSYKAETYAFGNGGYFGSARSDDTIDNEGFMDIAKAISGPLAEYNFLPTKDPKNASLLIMVYWGATGGSLDPASENFRFDSLNQPQLELRSGNLSGPLSFQGAMVDLQNAIILGYADDIAASHPRIGIIHNVRRDDLIDDVEHSRYFVVMMAYDFQAMWKEKKHKLLWETRFSIREQGNDFTKMLPSMAMYASQYFGQNSHGLVRRAIPEGNVEIGVPKTVDAAPGKSSSLSDTTLIADADTFSGKARSSKRDLSALPAPLAGRIAAYESDKAALLSALSAKIKAQAPGDETRRAIDSFNTENSTRISALNRDAERIRGELATLSATSPSQDSDQPVDVLVRQFNERLQEIRMGNPLFTHP
jgi:hypothetical protein